MSRTIIAVLALVIVATVAARQQDKIPKGWAERPIAHMCVGTNSEGEYINQACALSNWQIDQEPKEWDEMHNPMDEPVIFNGCPECSYKVHHEACEDKSRFLLHDGNGKPHCLKLVP